MDTLIPFFAADFLGTPVWVWLTFLGIVAWAWSSRRKTDFDEAARLPFLDDESALEGHGEKR